MITLEVPQIGYSLNQCYLEVSFKIVYYSSVVLIVIHEIVLFSVYPQMESLQKVITRILLQTARVLVLMTYILYFVKQLKVKSSVYLTEIAKAVTL